MKNYDHLHTYFRPGFRPVTIAMLKKHRLYMKNKRREANGLPPIENYSLI